MKKENKLNRKTIRDIGSESIYTCMVNRPSKINPIFTGRPHYDIPEPGKEAEHDKKRS